MIGVTHLFGCNENKPIDGAFSHRPEPPHPTSCLFILHTSGRQIAARGILQQPVGERGSVFVCVCVCVCVCVQICQPVTLHTLLMCMTELSPLLPQLINLC